MHTATMAHYQLVKRNLHYVHRTTHFGYKFWPQVLLICMDFLMLIRQVALLVDSLPQGSARF